MIRPFLLLALVASTASAHDFWLEPSTFRPHAGDTVAIGLRVGQDFVGDPVPRSSASIESFVIRDAAGERAIGGMENRDPAGVVKIERDGGAVVAYRSKPSSVQLAPEKFESYLRDEGLERIIAMRKQRGDSAKPGNEIFSRCAKLLLNSSKSFGKSFSKPLGLRYELVPLTDPASDALTVRALYESKPLPGSLVVAMFRDDVDVRLEARTDRDGRVTFRLPQRGVWLLKSVQMIPAPAASGAEWESLWASLTFER
ncbi:MAG TPA: DUF4198 domain-containing protein [Thermoanaerobaculia bacterium]|nr:DUF4198 domain-containing protein [Thermoanaerobaculia bacterium]